ncbi:MAG: NUDIX hydrolase [Corynebacterium sp.]|nr:NUDIX hydrolase [Corynebacterium sp.]
MPTLAALNETTKDARFSTNLSGRFHRIPRHPAKEFESPIFAAGAVLWRLADGDDASPLPLPADQVPLVTRASDIAVAVIHRPHYDDWSLAKGKVDPGESLPVVAQREISEETGYEVTLGKLLGHVQYPIKRHTKVVYYWTAYVHGGEFAANEEVDEIRWLSFKDASKLLSYDADREVLAAAAHFLERPVTSTLILVRHAQALPRAEWDGHDNLRPLTPKGEKQAKFLQPVLASYHPSRMLTASPDRCRHTLEPSAGNAVTALSMLDDASWEQDATTPKQQLRQLTVRPGTTVVCSQGGAIPEILSYVSKQGQVHLPQRATKKAGMWVLHFHFDELIGADYFESPLPLRD